MPLVALTFLGADDAEKVAQTYMGDTIFLFMGTFWLSMALEAVLPLGGHA